MSGDEDMRLADGFEAADYAAWRTLVEKALKGADFEKTLTTGTDDGFRLQPLYGPDDAPTARLAPASGRSGRAAAWDIRQVVAGPEPADVAAQIAEELGEGATSVLLRFDAAFRAGATPADRPDDVGRGGAALHTEAALATALAGVDLGTTPIGLDAGAGGLAAAKALLRLAGGPLTPGAALGIDPALAVAAAGLARADAEAWIAEAAGFDAGDGVFVLTASSQTFFDAGASEAVELGCMLAAGVACLRGLEAAGLSVAAAAARIAFRLAISQDQFMTIAKARAARALWANVLGHAGAADAAGSMRLEGVTAERMFTRHDPHVNMLRATIAGFAGAVGGLDGLTVLPFDARVSGHDPLARRVARNLQIVLTEESNLAKVADPAGGAFFVEHLTTELGRAAWAVFRKIEAAGGVFAALEDGLIAGWIDATRSTRAARLANRRQAITGVSEFANLAEPDRAKAGAGTAAAAGWSADGALLPSRIAPGEGPLRPDPLAAPFEALRDASDAYLQRTGGRPAVFLANIGALAAFTARASFARNAFAAGGVAVAGAGEAGFDDPAALVEAFKASGAPIACICGADAGYAANAEAFAAALKAAGARQVWLAGRPGDAKAALEAAGVDDYIFMGADILAALAAAHRVIGV